MNGTNELIEIQARHLIAERLAHASAPRLPAEPHRHRFARRLRRLADRIDT
jgi:hypothetical protein